MLSDTITVVIADGHLLSRVGIRSLLSQSPNYKIVGEASESSSLLPMVTETTPKVVIIDYDLPGSFDVADIGAVYKASPTTHVMVVTTNEKKDDILKTLEYGVNNYILKICDEKEFLEAVSATARNEKFFCGRVIDALLEKHFPKNIASDSINLSPREIEIVGLISQGYTNKTIATELHLSVHTVSTHRKNILKKLDLNNSSELVSYAIQKGIITPEKR